MKKVLGLVIGCLLVWYTTGWGQDEQQDSETITAPLEIVNVILRPKLQGQSAPSFATCIVGYTDNKYVFCVYSLFNSDGEIITKRDDSELIKHDANTLKDLQSSDIRATLIKWFDAISNKGSYIKFSENEKNKISEIFFSHTTPAPSSIVRISEPIEVDLELSSLGKNNLLKDVALAVHKKIGEHANKEPYKPAINDAIQNTNFDFNISINYSQDSEFANKNKELVLDLLKTNQTNKAIFAILGDRAKKDLLVRLNTEGFLSDRLNVIEQLIKHPEILKLLSDLLNQPDHLGFIEKFLKFTPEEKEWALKTVPFGLVNWKTLLKHPLAFVLSVIIIIGLTFIYVSVNRKKGDSLLDTFGFFVVYSSRQLQGKGTEDSERNLTLALDSIKDKMIKKGIEIKPENYKQKYKHITSAFDQVIARIQKANSGVQKNLDSILEYSRFYGSLLHVDKRKYEEPNYETRNNLVGERLIVRWKLKKKENNLIRKIRRFAYINRCDIVKNFVDVTNDRMSSDNGRGPTGKHDNSGNTSLTDEVNNKVDQIIEKLDHQNQKVDTLLSYDFSGYFGKQDELLDKARQIVDAHNESVDELVKNLSETREKNFQLEKFVEEKDALIQNNKVQVVDLLRSPRFNLVKPEQMSVDNFIQRLKDQSEDWASYQQVMVGGLKCLKKADDDLSNEPQDEIAGILKLLDIAQLIKQISLFITGPDQHFFGKPVSQIADLLKSASTNDLRKQIFRADDLLTAYFNHLDFQTFKSFALNIKVIAAATEAFLLKAGVKVIRPPLLIDYNDWKPAAVEVDKKFIPDENLQSLVAKRICPMLKDGKSPIVDIVQYGYLTGEQTRVTVEIVVADFSHWQDVCNRLPDSSG